MGIRFLCPSCRNKVHVKDRLAGLRGFCPTCGAKVDIPFQSTLPGKASAADANDSDHQPHGTAAPMAAASTAALNSAARGEVSVSAILPRVGRLVAVHMNPPADPLAGGAGAVWYVVPPEGTEPFGPADSATLNQWLQQGRIVSRSLVWRQDWPEWRKAGTVWSHLALNDVDPRMQRNTERVRGATGPNAGPQFASPRVPSSPIPGSGPAQATMPGRAAAVAPGSLMSQMAAMGQAPGQSVPSQSSPAQPARGPTPTSPAAAPSRSPLTAVPAALPPAAAPGIGEPAGGLYYPQRSQKLYWAIVGVLLIGLVGMSVALFYVLDQMQRQKQQSQPAGAATSTAEAPSDDSANDDSAKSGGSSTRTKPTGTRPQRTANP